MYAYANMGHPSRTNYRGGEIDIRPFLLLVLFQYLLNLFFGNREMILILLQP
jgi:hypothetical protein